MILPSGVQAKPLTTQHSWSPGTRTWKGTRFLVVINGNFEELKKITQEISLEIRQISVFFQF